MRNLIISAVGDESLHNEWIDGDAQFDLALIYYGNNETIAKSYEKEAKWLVRLKGMKYHLIDQFLHQYPSIIGDYDFVWLPDNDVSISTDAINQLFTIAKEQQLELCQPAMTGYLSHPITKPSPRLLLRYTNFIEVLAPLMSAKSLPILQESFTLNYSGWGFDYLWPYLLGNPRNTIAIIDAITMRHTKPVGNDYSRFPTHPKKELKNLLKKYKGEIKEKQVVYGLKAL
jgi:hypothetical protein